MPTNEDQSALTHAEKVDVIRTLMQDEMARVVAGDGTIDGQVRQTAEDFVIVAERYAQRMANLVIEARPDYAPMLDAAMQALQSAVSVIESQHEEASHNRVTEEGDGWNLVCTVFGQNGTSYRLVEPGGAHFDMHEVDVAYHRLANVIDWAFAEVGEVDIEEEPAPEIPLSTDRYVVVPVSWLPQWVQSHPRECGFWVDQEPNQQDARGRYNESAPIVAAGRAVVRALRERDTR